MNPSYQITRHLSGSAALFDEQQALAQDGLESMSGVVCALIFQSARDLVCAKKVLRAKQSPPKAARQAKPVSPAKAARQAKAVRQAEQRIDEITKWANTVFPLRFAGGGMSLAGAIATINLYQEHRGVCRLEYHVVKKMLLTKPHRLAVVDGPAKFRTLTNTTVEDLASAVSEYEEDEHESQRAQGADDASQLSAA